MDDGSVTDLQRYRRIQPHIPPWVKPFVVVHTNDIISSRGNSHRQNITSHDIKANEADMFNGNMSNARTHHKYA